MSLRDCIIKAAKAGIINDTKKQDLLKQFDDNLEEFSKTLSKAEATKAASQRTFLNEKKKVKQKAIEDTIQIVKQKELEEVISTYKNNKGDIDMAEGFIALHGKSNAPLLIKNLEIRQRDIYTDFTSKISDLILHYKNPLIMKWKKATPQSLVEELFSPSSTGNKGAEIIAKSLSEVFEDARVMLAKNGVLVNKDPNWHLPQSHNSRAIAKLKDGEWVSLIKPLLDKTKMIDNQSGKTFDLLPDEVFDQALTKALYQILNDGLGAGKKTGLAKFKESRFLVFKNAKSYMEYNTKMGTNPVVGIYQHLDMIARAIAETEIFGPKPVSTRNYLKKAISDKAKQQRLTKRKGIQLRTELERTANKITKADTLYDLFTGKAYQQENNFIAGMFGAARHFATGTLLGASGPVILVGDLATTFQQAALRGLNPFKAIRRSLKEQFTGKKASKQTMFLKLLVDDLIQNNMSLHRFVDEIETPGMAQAYSTTMLRLGAITRFTQKARDGVGKYLLSEDGIGSYAKFSYDDIELKAKGFNKWSKFKRMLDQYGITKEDWDIIRKTEMVSFDNKLKFIDPKAIANRTDIDPKVATTVAHKLMNMIFTEQDHAVIINSLRASAYGSKLQRGNLLHEVGLSAFMFKSFPLNAVIHNLARAWTLPPTGFSKVRWTAYLLGAMTVAGATHMMLQDMLSGKDPQDPSKKEFWFQALLRSGTFGPYGDILFAASDRRSFGLLASGPIASLFADVWGLTGAALWQSAFSDDKINYGGRVSQFIRNWSPKTWYTKLLLQRYLHDQLSLWLNDNHYKNKKRYKRKLREKGSGYWWKPDELLPDRPPQLN